MTTDSEQTSQAVKAVIAEVRNRLPYFNDLVLDKPVYYDINRDYEPIFQQIYALQSPEKLKKPWIMILYSYDSPQRKSVQCRTFPVYRSINAENNYVKLEAGYVTTNLLISIFSNDSNTIDRVSERIRMRVNWDFTTEFEDLMWLPWQGNQAYSQGNVIQPTIYNSYLYKCMQSGTSGKYEPDWSDNTEITDNNIIWQQMIPEKLKVRAYDFIASTITQDSILEHGVRFKLDLGCTMFYTILDDSDDIYYKIQKAYGNIRDYNTQSIIETLKAEN